MRIVSLFSALIIISCAMSSCSEITPKETALSENAQITIYLERNTFSESFSEICSEYSKNDPSVTFDIQYADSGANYIASLKAAFNNENQPVIFSVGGTADINETQNIFHDLSETEIAPLERHGLVDNANKNNKIKAVPFGVKGTGIICNTSLLRSIGIDTNEIQDFKSLKQAAAQIKNTAAQKSYEQTQLKFPFGPFDETAVNSIAELMLTNAYGSAIDLYDSSEIKIDDLKYTEQFISFIAENSAPSEKDRIESFSRGECAMIIGSSDDWRKITNENIEATMIPLAVKGFKQNAIMIQPNCYLAINKNSDGNQIKAAEKFLKYLLISHSAKVYEAGYMHMISPYEGSERVSPADPLSKSVKAYINSGNVVVSSGSGVPRMFYGDKLYSAFYKYAYNKSDKKEFEKSLDEIFKITKI